jgi:hypothetical protein
VLDLSIIQTQLDEMNENLSQVKQNLDHVLKKDDIEALIKTTVCNIMDELEKICMKILETWFKKKQNNLIYKLTL